MGATPEPLQRRASCVVWLRHFRSSRAPCGCGVHGGAVHQHTTPIGNGVARDIGLGMAERLPGPSLRATGVWIQFAGGNSRLEPGAQRSAPLRVADRFRELSCRWLGVAERHRSRNCESHGDRTHQLSADCHGRTRRGSFRQNSTTTAVGSMALRSSACWVISARS